MLRRNPEVKIMKSDPLPNLFNAYFCAKVDRGLVVSFVIVIL